MTEADLAACVALSTEARWNQVADDWALFLAHGSVHGIEAPDGRLVATTATLPLGARLAWISMVLVTAKARGRGLATRLVRHAIEEIEAAGRVAGLDATPDGRRVYGRLGFADIFGLTRLRRKEEGPAAARPALPAHVRPAVPADLPAMAALDEAAIGGGRLPILEALLAWRPDLAFVVEREGALGGFALGRTGRTAAQVGPVIARDPAVGESLLAALLPRLRSEAVIVDLADHREKLRGLLERCGFEAERPFTRMIRGQAPAMDPSALVAAAGPELA